MIFMDKLSAKILNILENDCRHSADELAQMLNVGKDEVEKTIEKLEGEEIICGYKAMIDWDKFSDTHVTALIELKVTPQKIAGFENMAHSLSQMPEVESVYLMSGAYDFSVTVQGKSFKDVALFVAKRLATLDGVVSTATHFVLRRYKELGVTLDRALPDDRGTLSF